MKITGNSTREMFDRYNTVDAEDAKLAAERFGEFVRSRGWVEDLGEREG